MQLPEHSGGPGTEPGTGNKAFFDWGGWARAGQRPGHLNPAPLCYPAFSPASGYNSGAGMSVFAPSQCGGVTPDTDL